MITAQHAPAPHQHPEPARPANTLAACRRDVLAALHSRGMTAAALHDWLERRYPLGQIVSCCQRLATSGRLIGRLVSWTGRTEYLRPDAPPIATVDDGPTLSDGRRGRKSTPTWAVTREGVSILEVLIHLRTHPSSSCADIAAAHGAAREGVSSVVSRLAFRGLCISEGGKPCRYSITSSGVRYIERPPVNARPGVSQ